MWRPSEATRKQSPTWTSSTCTSGSMSSSTPRARVRTLRCGWPRASSALSWPARTSSPTTEWSSVSCSRWPPRSRYTRLSPRLNTRARGPRMRAIPATVVPMPATAPSAPARRRISAFTRPRAAPEGRLGVGGATEVVEAGEPGDGDGAGDLTAGITAHAVGDGEDVGAGQHGVLVEVAHQPVVGRGAPPHLDHPADRSDLAGAGFSTPTGGEPPPYPPGTTTAEVVLWARPSQERTVADAPTATPITTGRRSGDRGRHRPRPPRPRRPAGPHRAGPRRRPPERHPHPPAHLGPAGLRRHHLAGRLGAALPPRPSDRGRRDGDAATVPSARSSSVPPLLAGATTDALTPRSSPTPAPGRRWWRRYWSPTGGRR